MGPAINPDVLKAAVREDEEDQKTGIYTFRSPPNQAHVLQAFANYNGIGVPVLLRRIVKDWIATTASK